MKHLAKFAALAAVVGLWSCSDDTPDINTGTEESTGDFYAKITLQLPTNGGGSRSETKDPDEGNDPAQSTDGYEFGKDYENQVNDLYVVLATANKTGDNITGYTYVTHAQGTPVQVSAGSGTNPASGNQPTFVMQFPTSDLKAYASDGTAEDKELYVFAFCNPSNDDVAQLTGNTFVDATGKITDGKNISIAAQNKFLMTNAEISDITINKTWAKLTQENGTKETAFNLTPDPVKVERVACRFDFMRTNASETKNGDVYPIYDNTTTDNVNYANVVLKEMALFNVAKEFYLLRHMSPTGTDTDWSVCTTEYGSTTDDNYVVSPNWDAYQNATESTIKDLASSFFYPLSSFSSQVLESDNDLDWRAIGSLKENDTDGSSQSPTWSFSGTDYKIWRYGTENTIPGTAQQRYGITTGVVFKAEITGAVADPKDPYAANATDADKALDNRIAWAIKEGLPIYAYREVNSNNTSKANLTMIFGTAQDMYEYVASHQGSPQYKNFVKAWQKGVFTATSSNGNPVKTEADLFPKSTTNDNGEVVEAPEITIGLGTNATDNETLSEYNLICYAPNKSGAYECYYYYFNRHNNNGDNSDMGPMEFATVRNNIYKLKVDNIYTVGLPSDTPPDPWTPDENPEVYFKVSVKVLDWVVRKNNIIF